MANELTLRMNSVTFIQGINNPMQHGQIVQSLPSSLEGAMDGQPIKQLVNSGADKMQIENLVAVLILKYGNMLAVSGGLKQGQPLEIAKMLVEEYPYNSIEDFNVMLSRGVKSRYGQIFRFDISVIYDWMQKYTDEFYEERERLVKANKVQEVVTSVHQERSEEENKRIDELLNGFLKQIEAVEAKKPFSMSREDIQREGREKPNRPNYIPDPELIVMSDLRIRYSRENYDARTMAKLPNWLPFDEWLRMGKQTP
jgi:hypothetical protein